ncbi:MAG: hypothetical protein ABIF77_21805 [bacterium]
MRRIDTPHTIRPLVALLGLVLLTAGVLPRIATASGDRDDPFYNTYHGQLTVEVTCSMPAYTASATMDVDVDRHGTVTISEAVMNYGGSEDLQGCTYTRTGTWNLAPLGVYMDGPPAHLDVNENITFSEHIQMECPPPAGFEKWPSGLLDGHLAFDWFEATTGTAVVEAVTGEGDLTRWSLFLIVNVPTEAISWTAFKVRYGGPF